MRRQCCLGCRTVLNSKWQTIQPQKVFCWQESRRGLSLRIYHRRWLFPMSSLVVPSMVCTARLKPIAGHAARARNWRSLRGTKGLLLLQYVNWFMYLLTFWHLFWKLERRFWFLGFCPIPQIKCLNRLSVFSRTFFRWPNWTHFGVLIKMWLNVGNVQKPKVEKQVLFVCNNWIIKWITTNRFWLIASWLTLIVILSKKTKYHV